MFRKTSARVAIAVVLATAAVPSTASQFGPSQYLYLEVNGATYAGFLNTNTGEFFIYSAPLLTSDYVAYPLGAPGVTFVGAYSLDAGAYVDIVSIGVAGL